MSSVCDILSIHFKFRRFFLVALQWTHNNFFSEISLVWSANAHKMPLFDRKKQIFFSQANVIKVSFFNNHFHWSMQSNHTLNGHKKTSNNNKGDDEKWGKKLMKTTKLSMYLLTDSKFLTLRIQRLCFIVGCCNHLPQPQSISSILIAFFLSPPLSVFFLCFFFSPYFLSNQLIWPRNWK